MEVATSEESPYKTLCTGCLIFGRDLHPIRDEKLKQCYMDIIKEIPLYNPAITCPNLCLECSSSLQKVVSFRNQVQDCYRILQAYTSETLTEFLLSAVARPPRLRVHTLNPVVIAPAPSDCIADSDTDVEDEGIKQELKNECDFKEENVEFNCPVITEPESKYIEDKNKVTVDVDDEGVYVKDELKNEDREDLVDTALSDGAVSDSENLIEEHIQSLLVEIKTSKGKAKKKKRKYKNVKNVKISEEVQVTYDLNKIVTIELSYEQMMEERQKEAKKESYLRAEHRCDSCLIGFNYKSSYTSHMAAKHSPDIGDYSCVICKSIFPTVESFQNHYRRHMRRYECGLCQKRTLDMKVMEQHYYSAHQISLKQYPCPMCAHVSNSIDLHRYHKDTHKARVQCPECDKTFIHRAGLMNHRLAVHELHNSFPCTVCSKVFRWKTSLKRHLEKHDEGKPSQPAAAYCSACKISFASVCSYKRHMKNSLKHVAQDQLKYVCDHCNKRFADKTKLRDHIEEKHLHKTYQCHICLKPSKNRVGLDQHIRNVHRGRPNNKMCHLCGKGFPTKVQLECHIRTHTGERPFICEHCPTMFSQQSNLYKHNRQVHLNMKSKRYPPVCKKRDLTTEPKEPTVSIADDVNRCADVDITIQSYRPTYQYERYHM